MELEEARSFFKEIYEDNMKLLKGVNEIGKPIEVEKLVRAISAILQALDNSIPKEKVLAKMQELEDMTKDYTKEYYYSNYRYTMNTLKDLLEE